MASYQQNEKIVARIYIFFICLLCKTINPEIPTATIIIPQIISNTIVFEIFADSTCCSPLFSPQTEHTSSSKPSVNKPDSLVVIHSYVWPVAGIVSVCASPHTEQA